MVARGTALVRYVADKLETRRLGRESERVWQNNRRDIADKLAVG